LPKNEAAAHRKRRAAVGFFQVLGGELSAEIFHVGFFHLDQLGEAVAFEGGHHVLADFFPGAVDRAEDLPVAGFPVGEAVVQIQRALLCHHHVQQGHFVRVLAQKKTAANAPLRADDALLDQGLQDFGQKSRSDVLVAADVFFIDDLSPRLTGQVE
jgi:hypothetical protein